MPNRIVVSLGSNIEKEKNLPHAVRLLAEFSHLLRVSGVYQTAPIGLTEQPPFWNAAVLIESELDALSFKQNVLYSVEQRLKRVRTADKNAPRTIDADITLFNEDIFDLDENHHIPDPDLLRFSHVAVPIADLLPNMIHPETGETFYQIAERLIHNAKALEQTTPLLQEGIVLA
jgi:2-amino-4-hydroxy-6-hydroxymethyldihydropteridine diphosphokinase